MDIEFEGMRHAGFLRAVQGTDELMGWVRARVGSRPIMAFNCVRAEPYGQAFHISPPIMALPIGMTWDWQFTLPGIKGKMSMLRTVGTGMSEGINLPQMRLLDIFAKK